MYRFFWGSVYIIRQYHTLHLFDFSELEGESFMLPVEDDIPASQEVSENEETFCKLFTCFFFPHNSAFIVKLTPILTLNHYINTPISFAAMKHKTTLANSFQ